MKADRKRLKAEKTDLVSQMQQLYATLESREEQLRDFIRNYEQHRKVSAEPSTVVSWHGGAGSRASAKPGLQLSKNPPKPQPASCKRARAGPQRVTDKEIVEEI